MTMKRRLQRLERLTPQPKVKDETDARDRLRTLIVRTRASTGLLPDPVVGPRADKHPRPTPATSDTRSAAEKVRDFLADHKRNKEADDDPQ